jgi:putative ABC transport system permease protein
VIAAGASQYIPFCGSDASLSYFIDGRPVPRPGEGRSAMATVVTPEYLSTLGVRLIRGRPFSDHDRFESAPVILINRAMAQREWPGEDPIGRGIRIGNPSATVRIVAGVVENVKVENLKEPPVPQVYLPFAQSPALAMYVVARPRRSSAEPLAAIRSAAAVADRSQPVYDTATMEQRIAVQHTANLIVTRAVTLFAVIALFLAAIGVYGVISYSVATRRREIGVRMALGARTGDVLALVLGQGLRLSVLGIAAGVLGSIGMSRLLGALLFQVSPTDVVTFVLVSLLLGAVAILACYFPARRAASIDPVVTLRYE